jgi:YfiH family protein
MFKDRGEYLVIEEFEELGVGTIFTDKSYGDVKEELFLSSDRLKNQEKFLRKFGLEGRKLVYGSQVHSANVADIDETIDNLPYPETDGFITTRRDVVIFTQYADCLPIYLYSEEKEVIGLCHSGWQGSYLEIGIEALKRMTENYGCDVEEITVTLGIGIGICCYEVGDDFYEKFRVKYGEELLEGVFQRRNDRWYFDNTEFNYKLLLRAGVKKIYRDSRCTYCDERFHSYRREGKASGRNGAFIYFKD